MLIKRLSEISIFVMLSSCGGLFGIQTTGGGGSTSIEVGEDGSVSRSVSPSSSAALSASSGSDIEGASAFIPAGSISVATNISLGNGGALDSLAENQFADLTSVESGGAAVSFSAENSEATLVTPASLALPVSSALTLANTQYAVIYQVKDGTSYKSGLIASQDFKASGETTITVEVSYFGTYQVIIVPSTVNVSVISEIVDTSLTDGQGIWQTGCFLSGTDEYSIETLEISTTNLNYKSQLYSGSDCETGIHFMEHNIKATIVARPSATGAFNELDILVSNASITPKFESTATGFNTSAQCGLTNWELDVANYLETCPDDPGMPLPGMVIYEIFSISGTNLIMGSGGGSPTARPTALEPNTDRYFVKQ
jgi:hypothetical protein